MKRIIAVLLVAIILAFTLTSCVATPVSEERGAELEEFSRTIIEEFLQGEYSTLIDMGSDEIKNGISTETLDEILVSLVTNENIKEPTEFYATMEGTNEVMQVVVPASTMNLLFLITYTHDNIVVGFFITKLPLSPEVVTNDDFTEEAIEISAGDITMQGRLTIPTGVENPDVAIIISGSGPQGMDGVIGTSENAVYRDIAHGLAKQGIASIRYDDRFYPLVPNSVSELTVQSEVLDDVNTVVEIANDDERLGEVFLLGHSFGGMLSPYLAENNEDVEGFVSLAGSPRKLEYIMYDQSVDALDAAGITGDERDEQLNALELEIEKIKAAEDDPNELVLGQPENYWYSLNQVTGEDIAKNINCPALIIQGSEDFQVKVEEDFVLWQELLDGNTNVEFIEYEGLNHLFMASQEQSIEDYNIANNVDEQVIIDIADFIKEN